MSELAAVKASGVVYAITDGDGYVKIGVSTRAALSRLEAMQTGNRHTLTLLAECQCDDRCLAEGNVHDWLTDIGLHEGGEWFKPSVHLTIFVALMQDDNLDEAGAYLNHVWHYRQLPPADVFGFVKFGAMLREADYALDRARKRRAAAKT